MAERTVGMLLKTLRFAWLTPRPYHLKKDIDA
ncbi:MAG: hypothetical protein FD153_564 [Rhodospirillaceae bacterium]|nr:MAG: hypothetical protein FD153_564 [Rhodospirillaceae bacterium]